jgi:hypothetical protein
MGCGELCAAVKGDGRRSAAHAGSVLWRAPSHQSRYALPSGNEMIIRSQPDRLRSESWTFSAISFRIAKYIAAPRFVRFDSSAAHSQCWHCVRSTSDRYRLADVNATNKASLFENAHILPCPRLMVWLLVGADEVIDLAVLNLVVVRRFLPHKSTLSLVAAMHTRCPERVLCHE